MLSVWLELAFRLHRTWGSVLLGYIIDPEQDLAFMEQFPSGAKVLWSWNTPSSTAALHSPPVLSCTSTVLHARLTRPHSQEGSSHQVNLSGHRHTVKPRGVTLTWFHIPSSWQWGPIATGTIITPGRKALLQALSKKAERDAGRWGSTQLENVLQARRLNGVSWQLSRGNTNTQEVCKWVFLKEKFCIKLH